MHTQNRFMNARVRIGHLPAGAPSSPFRVSKGAGGRIGGIRTQTEQGTKVPAMMHLWLYILNSMNLRNIAVATTPALRG